MYGAIINSRPVFGGMIQVQGLGDIPYLVKESEVVTGMPGRKFYVRSKGNGISRYRIQCHSCGYRVHRLDSADASTGIVEMPHEHLIKHELGKAAINGGLFTDAA